MKADFSYYTILIFEKQMMELARKYNMVPKEIYSKKGKPAKT